MTSSDNSGSWFFPEFAPPFPEPVENPISELFDAALSGAHSPSADPRDPERSLHEARQQVAQIEKEAYEKAFLLGEKAGRELGETAAASLIEKLAVYLDEISSLRGTLVREAERETLELAFQIARAVVKVETDRNRDAVLDNVRKAFERIGAEGKVTLRVHPSDASAVFGAREALSPYLEGKGEFRVETDESIERGGCLAVTDFTEADATIAGQFAALYEQLKRAHEEHE